LRVLLRNLARTTPRVSLVSTEGERGRGGGTDLPDLGHVVLDLGADRDLLQAQDAELAGLVGEGARLDGGVWGLGFGV